MPDNQRNSSANISNNPLTCSSSSTNNINQGEVKVIRRFINSAIYVEKPIMPPLRKTSPIQIINNNNDSGYISTRTFIQSDRSSVKKCTCIYAQKKSCACHCLDGISGAERSRKSSKNLSDSSTCSGDSQVTVKSNNNNNNNNSQVDDLRLSLSSLPTERTGTIDPKEKAEMIRSWLQKKDRERKKKEQEEAKLKEEKEKQRQLLLEKEKENYKKWLENKKMQEERARKEKERKEKEHQKQEAEKARKQKENEASYIAWLKRKKRTELEKKIKDKLALLKLYEDKQKRMEENEKAFEEWLKGSKDKPRPVPLNKGLESLCSSTSVTYINPVPWIPNVDIDKKPSSQ